MTWPDPRWHDRCTNCEHERCDHDYPKKGDPCHTCNLNGNLLGGSVCQRFEEKAKLNPGAWDDYQEALQYAYFCRCGKISVGPEGAPTRCGNCVTLTVWLRYRATFPEGWRQHERCARPGCRVPRSHHDTDRGACGCFIDEEQAQGIKALQREAFERRWAEEANYQKYVVQLRERPFRVSRVKYGLDATLLALLVVYGARGVTALFKIIWWITKNSAIGTAYGYQVWWWILTGRGIPPMLTMDGSDLCEGSAPAGQLD